MLHVWKDRALRKGLLGLRVLDVPGDRPYGVRMSMGMESGAAAARIILARTTMAARRVRSDRTEGQ